MIARSRYRSFIIGFSIISPIVEAFFYPIFPKVHFVLYLGLFLIAATFSISNFDFQSWNLNGLLSIIFCLYLGFLAILSLQSSGVDRSCWSIFLIGLLLNLSSITSTSSRIGDDKFYKFTFDFSILCFSIIYIVTFLIARDSIWSTLDSKIMGRIQPFSVALIVIGITGKRIIYLTCGLSMWLCSWLNYAASSNIISLVSILVILCCLRSKFITFITLVVLPIIYAYLVIGGVFQKIYFTAYDLGLDNTIIRFRLLDIPLQTLKNSLLFGTYMSMPLHTTDLLDGRDVPFHNDFITISYAIGLAGWGLLLILTFNLVTVGFNNSSYRKKCPQEQKFALSLYVGVLMYGLFNAMFGTYLFIFTYFMIALVRKPVKSTL